MRRLVVGLTLVMLACDVGNAWDLKGAPKSVPDEQYRSVSPRLSGAVRASLTVEGSLAARSSPGGTAPARVAEQLAALTRRVRDIVDTDI